MVGRFSVSLLFLIRVQNLVSLLIQEHTEGTSVTLFKFLSKESSLRFVEFKFLSKESSLRLVEFKFAFRGIQVCVWWNQVCVW